MKAMRKAVVILSFFIISQAAFAGAAFEDIPLLVDSEWLEENLERDNLVIVDFGRSPEDYAESHIPGAVYLDRKAVYDTVDGVNGMLPPPEQAIPHFEAAGISNNTTVVIYDAIGGLWASRLFWALEYFGHRRVHLLDGGYPNWVAENRPVTDDESEVARGTFRYKIRSELVADYEYIEENLDTSEMQIIDTRSLAEYTGTDVRAERGGHIPGAINIEWRLNIDESQQFLSIQELAEMYDSEDVDKSKTQITHCQTGVRGAHTYFVLRHLGYKDVKLFDESWVVWGNLPDTPIEQVRE